MSPGYNLLDCGSDIYKSLFLVAAVEEIVHEVWSRPPERDLFTCFLLITAYLSWRPHPSIDQHPMAHQAQPFRTGNEVEALHQISN